MQKVITKVVREVVTTVADTVAQKGGKATQVFPTKVADAIGDTVHLSRTVAEGGEKSIDHIANRVKYFLRNRLDKLPEGSRMVAPSKIQIETDRGTMYLGYQVDRTDPSKIRIAIKDGLDRGSWDDAVPYRTSLEMIMDKKGQMTWGRLFEGENLKWRSKDLPGLTEFVRSDRNQRCITQGSVSYRPVANSENWGVVENTVNQAFQAVSLGRSSHPFSKLFFELAGLKTTLT